MGKKRTAWLPYVQADWSDVETNDESIARYKTIEVANARIVALEQDRDKAEAELAQVRAELDEILAAVKEHEQHMNRPYPGVRAVPQANERLYAVARRMKGEDE